jgi:hypothetical protein
MNNITVKLDFYGHANLDSFPFRYGFYSATNINIELKNVTKLKGEQIHEPNNRFGVLASFELPNSKTPLRGKFIISKRDNSIITVIREGSLFKTEHFLSETLKKLRKDGDINTQDLMDMRNDGVSTHAQVVKTLSNKIGEKKVNKMSKILQSSREEIHQKDEHIGYLNEVVICAELEKDEADEKIIELEKKLEAADAKNNIFSFLSKTKGHSVNDKYNNSGTDWSKESTTSGVFKAYEVQGDYLVVTLHVAVKSGNPVIREIKCKNTHGGDYEKAVEDVKSLKDGDMITYKTRGSGKFGSGWFYKIEKDSQSESKSWVNTESI